MFGGGNVIPMGTGGMLDNYAGGGSIMNQYGHGGMVKQDMMNYKHGGKVHKNLKPVPQGNPGLGKLPEAVRNKMGYMKEGGEVESQTLKDMLDPYLPRKDDILPYLEFVTGASAETEDYQPGALDAALAIPLVGGVGSGIKRLIKSAGQKKALKNIAKQEDLARYTFPDYSGESLDISSKEMSNVLKILGGKYPKGTVVSYPKAGNRPAYEATVSPSGRFVPKGYQEGSMVEDSLMGMMGGGMANKAMKGYREGGTVIPFQMVDGSLEQSSRVDPNTNMPLYDARQVISVPAEEVGGGSGLRYYGGMDTGNKIENAMQEAFKLALATAESSPQDSIPADIVKKFLKPRKK